MVPLLRTVNPARAERTARTIKTTPIDADPIVRADVPIASPDINTPARMSHSKEPIEDATLFRIRK